MHRGTIAGPALGSFMAVTLCGLVPAWLYAATSARSDDPHWWLLSILVVSGLRFSAVLGSRRRRPHEMVFWLFTYVFLGMAPMVQFRLHMNPSTTPGLDFAFEMTATVIVLVGIAAFMLGSTFASPRIKASDVEVLQSRRVDYFAAAVLALSLYYMQALGFSNLFVSRSEFFGLKAAAWGSNTNVVLITAAVQMGLLVAYVALAKVHVQNRAEKLRRAPFLRWAVLIALLICTNPVSTPRYVFGTVILALLATAGAYSTLARYRTVMVSSIAGLLVLFPLADAFRLSTTARVEVVDPVTALTSGDFDSFAQIVNSAQLVSEQGIEYGRQLMGVIFFWVPSSIWAGKPTDTGAYLADYKGYEYTNLSAPMWAELFVNGGWLLLVVGFFVMGRVIRRLDAQAEAELRLSPVPGILGCIVPFYLLILLRGSLLSAVSNLAVIVVCAWFVSARTPQTTRRRPFLGATPVSR